MECSCYVESSKNLIGKTIDGIVIDTNSIKNIGTTFAICPVMDPNIRKNIYTNEILKLDYLKLILFIQMLKFKKFNNWSKYNI